MAHNQNYVILLYLAKYFHRNNLETTVKWLTKYASIQSAYDL